ncbi:protein O-mannosyl-transferase family [Patescibacteria group bacterium]
MKQKILLVLLFFLVIGVSFFVYCYTLAPTITAGDSSEMIAAAATLGIPHQSSYPVNTILGYLFTRLPWKTIPWRVNLMSAVLHSLTVGVIYWVILRVFSLLSAIPYTLNPKRYPLRPSHCLIAFGSALFLAFSRTFWINSLKAEVFPLNNLLASLMIFLILSYFLKPTAYRLIAFCLILGLGFSHHQTIILLVPASLYLIWRSSPELISGPLLKLVKFFLPEKQAVGLGEVKLAKKTLKVVFLSFLVLTFGLASYFSLMWLSKQSPEMNWGDPSVPSRLWRSFLRVDAGGFGSPAIYDTAPEKAPRLQLAFFGKNLVTDFTYWGVILGLLGLWGFWKRNRNLFFFMIIGILVAGPLFLVYANFPLEGGFSQATIIRFNLLSELFWTLLLSVGLFVIWEGVKKFTANQKDKSNSFARLMVSVGLGAIFLFPLLTHFKSVDQRENVFAYDLAEIMLDQTEDNAIILISGDIPNFAIDYLRFVEGKGGNRIIFSPGQMHMSWFVKQLKERYPELVVPPPYIGYRFTVTHQLIDGNWDSGRPVYIMPELSNLDPVVGESYLLWPKGLLFRVFKEESEIESSEFLAAADQLWQMIEPKKLNWLLEYQPNLDSPMYFYYTRHFFNLGFRLEEAEQYQDAIEQYQRTLEIDSGFGQAYKALGVIYGYKLPEEERDIYLAIENFQKYYRLAPSQQEAQAVEQAIQELSQPPVEATTSAELAGEEATGSGELVATDSGELIVDSVVDSVENSVGNSVIDSVVDSVESSIE